MSRAIVSWPLVALLASAGCAPEDGRGGADPSTPATRADAGRHWYVTYCASCHGVDGRGDGPAADALEVPPSDLTRIAARSDGRFDAATVARFIDGRERVGAHGPGDMPVWGRRFDDRLERSVVEETRLAPGSIYLLVEYLRSIQSLD